MAGKQVSARTRQMPRLWVRSGVGVCLGGTRLLRGKVVLQALQLGAQLAKFVRLQLAIGRQLLLETAQFFGVQLLNSVDLLFESPHAIF
jgi:hypothetical protein